MPKPSAFITLGDAMQGAVTTQWRKLQRHLAAQLKSLLAKGDFTGASELIAQITLAGLLEPLQPRLRELGISALLLGASKVKPISRSALVQGERLPPAFDHGLDQLQYMIEEDVSDRVRDGCFAVLRGVELDAGASIDAAVDQLLGPLTDDWLSVSTDILYSRLVSLGFLFQAALDALDQYQVCEELDGRECPVCALMNGRVFDVEREYDRVQQVLSTMDPAQLVSTARWPKQDAESVAWMAQLTANELQANGWGSPPYHPHCRGYLVVPGTVEETG